MNVNKEVKAPIGLLIISICGIITLLSVIDTLKKYSNYNDINYSETNNK